MTLQDPDYPPGLLQIDDPPLLLFIAGQRERLARPNLAVVGSRNATASGCEHARHFARGLSAAGWTITSGLALGIDAAAHAGGLAGGRGTLAVVGTGVDIVYPTRHVALAEQIRADGAVISELPLGTPPLPRLFPRRNRLIAGLSSGVLVVEAALRSGSLITARLAGEYGREVFAIPGSIDSPVARGCHALIRQGAKLVETVEEVLEECRAPGPAPGAPAELTSSPPGPSRPDTLVGSRGKDPVLDAIGFEAVLPDTLAEHLGWAAGTLAARLIELELEGSVQRHPDGRVTRPAPKG
jgi:DNA processing protein